MRDTRSASVCTGIDNVRDTLDMLERKIKELETYHDELASRSLLEQRDVSFLLVDPLYFQHRVLQMELSFWKEITDRFTNRVYADLYKLLLFLREESRANGEQNVPNLQHRVYKDLDFEVFTTSEISTVSDELYKIIELWKADLASHNAYVQRLRSQTDRGVNIQNLLNSEIHKTTALRDKLRYIKECIDSYTRYHEQFLTSFKVKLVVMHSEMTASLDLESSNVLETLKVDREEEEQLKQAVQQSTTQWASGDRPAGARSKRRWTIVAPPTFELENAHNEVTSDSEDITSDDHAPPGRNQTSWLSASFRCAAATKGALVVATIGTLVAGAASIATADAAQIHEGWLSAQHAVFSLFAQ